MTRAKPVRVRFLKGVSDSGVSRFRQFERQGQGLVAGRMLLQKFFELPTHDFVEWFSSFNHFRPYHVRPFLQFASLAPCIRELLADCLTFLTVCSVGHVQDLILSLQSDSEKPQSRAHSSFVTTRMRSASDEPTVADEGTSGIGIAQWVRHSLLFFSASARRSMGTMGLPNWSLGTNGFFGSGSFHLPLWIARTPSRRAPSAFGSGHEARR